MTRKSTRGKRSKDKERKRLQRIQLLETFYHFLTDAAWRQTRATQLGLPFPNERGVSAQENTYGIELSKPSTCHHVLGDGNCFFSSLSYVITGQEHYQHVLRHRICQHLLNHQEELKTYLPSHYNGDVQQYLVQSRMESNATWATEVEIFTAAHMLRTNIFVYTQHGDRWTWLKHSVGQPEGNTSIYLYHQGRCHYDVVLGITRSDTEQREQKNRRERERYFTDPMYRDKKKTQAQRTYDSEFRDTKKMTLQQRYSSDESYRENKKIKIKQRYSSDESYRENQKITSQQKYSSDGSYRENKKITSQQRYSSDESFRDNKKIKTQQKYSSDEGYRENKKIKTQQRYSSDESYRENKKIKTQQKYSNDVKYRECKKIKTQQKYASDEKYRNSKITRNKTDTKYRKHNVISTRQRYRTDIKYRNKKKQSARDRYHSQQLYRDHKKHMSILKYASNSQFRLTVRRYAVTKYKDIATFRNKVKTYSKKKYRQFSSFRNNLRAASIKKYASDPLFRSTLKKFLKEQYHQRRDIQKKKKAAVKERRASLDKAILAFRNSIRDTPRYPCCVCARLLFKKQIKFCDRAKYMDNGVLHPIVEKCLIENFQYDSKQWICFTCDNHLRARNMPPQAMANGLHITPIPKELKTLNSLERQLVALRIPFMKLLSLPKGGQRGVKGQVVNVPSDINSVTTSLPRSIDNAQMVKVKLKRKMSYKGHHQYEWVNPSNVIEAIKYLIQNNPWYSNITFKENWFDEEDADIVYTENSETDTAIETDIKQNIQENLEKSSKQEQTSVNIQNVPSENQKLDADTERDIQEESFEENPSHTVETRHSSVSTGSVTDHALYDADTEEEKSSNDQAVYDADTDEDKSSNDQAVYDADTDDENQECKEKRQFGNKRTDRVSDEDVQSYPVETCLQPLDLGQEFLDTNDKIFCVAPGENQVPVSIFQEDGSDAMAFPVLLPDGKFGFSFEREIKITPSKYFNCRLFSADDRFAKDNQFIFYAQYMVEIHNIRSNISVALRKGQQTCGDGRKITASMLTRSENLQEILKSDTGYRFLQPVRGTPPYWQRTMKDLYAMIRQLGIPTWFVTFSAGETRWDEVIHVLMKDDKRNIADIEWAEKCCLIRENPVMCARLFNNRVKVFSPI